MSELNTAVESPLFNQIYPKGYTPYRIKWFDIVIAALICLFAFILYVKTIPPSIIAGDHGELVTEAYNMGAGHPPGYPLWVMLGKLFTFIPVGDIAFRISLFIAVSGAGAVFFLYLICVKLLGLNRDKGNLSLSVHLPAIAASFAFAFSKTFWAQVGGGKMYPLNAMLVAIVLFVVIIWYEEMISYRSEPQLHFAERKTILLAFVMGLSLTNHQLPLWVIASFIVVMIPMTIAIVASERSKKFSEEFKKRAFYIFLAVAALVISGALLMIYGYTKRLIFEADVPYILTGFFLVPAFLTVYTVAVKVTKTQFNWVDKFFEVLTYGLWLFFFAFSIYLYLMVRARALAPLPDPKPLSWGDTQTLDILFNHITRKQYGIGGGSDISNFAGQLWEALKFHMDQYSIINFILVVVGLVVMFVKEKIFTIFTVVAMLFLTVTLVKFVNPDLDIRTLSFQIVMYCQNFLMMGIFLAFGYQFILDLVTGKTKVVIPNWFKKKDAAASPTTGTTTAPTDK
jgi:hypothetical protein